MKRLLLITILLLASCSETPVSPSGSLDATPVIKMVWPAAPAPPRIRLEYTFGRPEDLGIHPSGVRKLWNAIAGTQDNSMVRPYAVAVIGTTILVGDPGANAVHLFNRDRDSYLRIDEAGDEPLQSPVGVALGDDHVFVADSAAGKVFVFNTRGKLLETIEGLERPTGLAFDRESGLLYVAETLAHRIVVFGANGKRQFEFGQRGVRDGEFNFPSHLSLSDGELLVNDNMNFRIQSFDRQGRHLNTFGEHGDGSGYFSQPKGVAADAQGHVYVAGATIDHIQVFSGEGDFLLAFGGEGDGPGRFVMPAGLAIEDDVVYVADSLNRRLQVFRYIGAD